jgi:hypothetical protein
MSLNQIFNSCLSNKEIKSELIKINPNYKTFVTKTAYGQGQMLSAMKEIHNQTLNEVQNSR